VPAEACHIKRMLRSPEQLREDVRRIWWAGVAAVQPARLVPEHFVVEGSTLWIGEREFDLQAIDRIAVVGAGKASGAMVVAVEEVLGEALIQQKQVTGWVNVPADCVEPTRAVRLHPGRPAGVNEPTVAGMEGTREILQLVASLGPRDLCLCLISGGGSALLPAPIPGLSLETKIALTREVSANGGDITQLNTVRRELSEIKGGGLASACRAGQLATLVLSDVLGDDLETIASGPTVPRQPTPEAALAVLADLDLLDSPEGQTVAKLLQQPRDSEFIDTPSNPPLNLLIGNNVTAVDSAGIEAERHGYSHAMLSATAPEKSAEEVARWLTTTAESMRATPGPDCFISGGEPTVRLASAGDRGKGGRCQQLALAALESLDDWSNLALIAGGTDGEDGPTDAAGALVDQSVVMAALELGLDAADYLRRNDAYHFFEKAGGLFKTGPTGTNVCDLRVVCVSKDGRE
jgi:glycerate 2-kinase